MKHLTLIAAMFFMTMNLAQAQNEQKIASGDEAESSIKGAQLSVDEPVCELGEIREGTKAKATFTIVNTGDQPLVILEVKRSCGCTDVVWPKEPLAPGDEGEITAIYNSQGRPGNFVKTLTVKHNGDGGNVYLTLRGMVLKAQE